MLQYAELLLLDYFMVRGELIANLQLRDEGHLSPMTWVN